MKPEEQKKPKVDLVEVSREAHQLSHSHGRNAHRFAERQAEKAAREGNAEEAEFWRAVYGSLRPR